MNKHTPALDSAFELPAAVEWFPEPEALSLHRAWVAASEDFARQVALQSKIEDRVFALQREQKQDLSRGNDPNIAVLTFPKAAAETASINAELSQAEARTDELVDLERKAFDALMAYKPTSFYGVALKILVSDACDDEMAGDAAADIRRLIGRRQSPSREKPIARLQSTRK